MDLVAKETPSPTLSDNVQRASRHESTNSLGWIRDLHVRLPATIERTGGGGVLKVPGRKAEVLQVCFGPFRFEPGQRPVARRRGGPAAAARARRPGGARSRSRAWSCRSRRCSTRRGRTRSSPSVAARGDPRAARGARRRPAQPDLHPDRPSPRLPLRRHRPSPLATSVPALQPPSPPGPPSLPAGTEVTSGGRRSPGGTEVPGGDGGCRRGRRCPGTVAAADRRRRVRDGRDDRHRDRVCAARPAAADAATDDAVHDRAAGGHGDRSAARVGGGVARRHAHGLRRRCTRAGRASSCARSIATRRSRSTAPMAPPIRSSRPTVSGSASSRTAA